MKKEISLTAHDVFVLQETDEMRHPYESAVDLLNVKLSWFHSWGALLFAATKQEPTVVVIDLDCMPQPLDPEFAVLRSHFTHSDLIGLSSSDSAQLALQCMRAGFSDFLLKPASPEELSFALRKSLQRREMIGRIEDPRLGLIRAVTQISGCTTPTLAKVCTSESLLSILRGKGAAWISLDSRGKEYARVICSVPRNVESVKILATVPFDRLENSLSGTLIVRNKSKSKKTTRKVLIPCRHHQNGLLYIWGIEKTPTKATLQRALLLLEHAELTLMNLQKFEDIKQQTFVDDLTGLYNSRYLKYALANSILRCKEPNQKFSVLFIDVDHFKAVNDKYSHLVGSEFLITIGKTVKNAVRRIDPVFRYGGDEFVVILNGTNVEGAHDIAERIRKNIERRVFVIKGKRIQSTVSIGIATYPDHAGDRDTLLRLADEAMYSAKRETRNAVHLALPAPEALTGTNG